MRRAIFLRFVLISLIVVCVSNVFSAIMFDNDLQQHTREKMYNALDIISKKEDFGRDSNLVAKEISSLCYGYRITLIDSQGRVLGDSEVDSTTMENHLDRIEVKNALIYGRADSQHYSDTIHINIIYVALKTPTGIIVRASIPSDTLNKSILTQLPVMLVVAIIALIISIFLSSRFSKTILQPVENVILEIGRIENGEYDTSLAYPDYEELTPLVASVNNLAINISTNLKLLESEKEKMEFLLDNMRQGLVVVDSNLRVLHHNKSANIILDSQGTIKGKSIIGLTYNSKIISAIENSIENKTSVLFDLEDKTLDRIYSVSINAINSQWADNGAIMIITDVTENRNGEQMRREFISNASHELKTPVTSIKGFAELLSSGLVTDTDKINDYLGRINSEADRITNLIMDILNLYAIEEDKSAKNIEKLNLLEEINEVVATLAPQAKNKNVIVSLTCDNMYIMADNDDIKQLVTNLVDNAIKYNKEGGDVQISLAQEGDNCIIKVGDTGIGIPAKDISRVFERFYRVDKGRSRSVGGTGLGLSIVKHIVAAYDGEILLSSNVGDGTQITVILPNKCKDQSADM